MATELSCLTDVDEDDNDADPQINALELLQEPVRMAQEPSSCTDSFSKPSLEQNSVLDVLSTTDMLSPVGLGNGPSSHQATQAHELNSLPTEKEETISITPLKTVQEIDTAGIWDFDADSPENSLDNFDNASDIHWNPHKEFMQFLWENHDDSPGEEMKEEILPANSSRRRKRKMDMVVMVDPSEDLYPDPKCKSTNLLDTEGQAHSVPVRKARKKRTFSKSQSSSPLPTPTVSQYPNGTVKAIKEILSNGPPQNSVENSIGHKALPLKRGLTMHSHSKGRSSSYPCTHCKLVFKKEHHLYRHMKSHADLTTTSPKHFICQECGQSFRQNSLLIEHVTNHHGKKNRLAEDVKSINGKKKEDKNKKLYCPQCPFGTNCPNKFVEHAKTHEKDKRRYNCEKCSFRTFSSSDLRRHDVMQHTVITVRKFRDDHPGNYACNICSYKAFSKNIFKNHLLRRHQLSFEEHEAEQIIEQIAQTTEEQYMHSNNSRVEDAELTSKMTIKNQISKRSCSQGETREISDLFKNDKMKKRIKSQLMESKLDKSIKVLLSRQRHGKTKESNMDSTPVHDLEEEEEYSQLSVKNKDVPLSSDDATTGSLLNEDRPKMTKDQSPLKKSPSKRKMSTPYRNTSDQDSCFLLSKPLPSPKKTSQDEDYADNSLSFNDSEANASFFQNGIKKEKQVIYSYSRRMSMRGALQASKRLFEKIKTEEKEQNDLEIKEEDIESEVDKTFESYQIPITDYFAQELSDEESERKSCPYCPAVFESGVGLSNHVRGHLHRAGLNYNARHVVSPEQVASHDKRPRIRKKMTSFRKLKKALQAASNSEDTTQTIHSCPLCGDSFDNRTGQSNHIRGHLKKLGKKFVTQTKTPLMLLRELMRDKKELQRALEIVGKNQNHFQYGASPKMRTAECFDSSSTGVQKSICTEARPPMSVLSIAEVKSENEHQETKLGVKNSLSGTTALIGILKKRKCQEDARLKASSQMSRNASAVSLNNDHSSGSKLASSLPKLISEKGEFNRKVCVHCNATFHSGVSLSNHLRAYAKRKRNALLEGTTFDCKARRYRSRPGPKKKTLPLPQTPEEMYRLTCRFCDLVFQGPLSVQEDWIKHLQRHIMNTSVPYTGLGMVEVTSQPSTLKTDQDSSLTATHAAS